MNSKKIRNGILIALVFLVLPILIFNYTNNSINSSEITYEDFVSYYEGNNKYLTLYRDEISNDFYFKEQDKIKYLKGDIELETYIKNNNVKVVSSEISLSFPKDYFNAYKDALFFVSFLVILSTLLNYSIYVHKNKVKFFNSLSFNSFFKSYHLKSFASIILISFLIIFYSNALEILYEKKNEMKATNYNFNALVSDIKSDRDLKVKLETHPFHYTIVKVEKKDELFNFYLIDTKILENVLIENNIGYEVAKAEQKKSIFQIIFDVVYFAFILILIFFIYKTFINPSSKGSGGGFSSMFGSNFKKVEKKPDVSMSDVIGLSPDIKIDIEEVINDINDQSNKDYSLGAVTPRGILMHGEPGVGKTLIAKAIANETGCDFFSLSGSSIGGILRGKGVADIKSLFEQAKKSPKAIIFIDEFDSIARKRGEGFNNEDSDETLNELLHQMDGFNENDNIFVIAATNLLDKLDPAILRPKRFDRKIYIPLPDYKGRKALLDFYAAKVKSSENLDFDVIAHQTIGFSGADIYNLVNESTRFAERARAQKVEMEHFEQARDKILIGHKLNTELDEEEKYMTAFHEAGHSIVSSNQLDKGHDPVRKISILPRGRALGVTMYSPEKESRSLSREKIKAQIKSLYGGRLAEELVYGEDKVTSGASNDYMVATQYAERMVMHFGLSDNNKLLTLGYKQNDFHSLSDDEKRSMEKILNECYQNAKEILENNKEQLLRLTKNLIYFETLDEEQNREIIFNNADYVPEDYKFNDKYMGSFAK